MCIVTVPLLYQGNLELPYILAFLFLNQVGWSWVLPLTATSCPKMPKRPQLTQPLAETVSHLRGLSSRPSSSRRCSAISLSTLRTDEDAWSMFVTGKLAGGSGSGGVFEFLYFPLLCLILKSLQGFEVCGKSSVGTATSVGEERVGPPLSFYLIGYSKTESTRGHRTQPRAITITEPQFPCL